MAESLVVAAAKLIGSVAWREVNQLRCFDRDLDNMEEKLVDIGALLRDAGEQSLELREGDVVRLWLRALRSVACDIHDVLGDYQAKTEMFQKSTKLQKAKQICTSSNPLWVKRSIASNIKELKRRLYEVADAPFVGRFTRQTSSVQMIENYERFVPENSNYIVGRDDDISKIMQLLQEAGGQNDVPILPIVGIGGVGKSTTARKIFQEALGFDLKIWVTVTRNFNWNKITRSILEDVDGRGALPDEVNLLIRLIGKKLGNKKCMLVLDDLWNEDHGALTQLKEILINYTGNGSQAIVTTRNTNVARLMWNITRPYKLEFLSNDDCWNLFSRMALPEDTSDITSKEVVGRELVQNCSGLPLLVRSLGSFMCQKETTREWRSVNASDIWPLVAPSLKLSYYHMPPQWRLCFQYCAVLPEGFEINKQNLMQQWVALDMVESTKAHECLRGLMNIHFLLYSNEPTQVDTGGINEPEVVRMHDMVHRLAKSVAADLVLVASASEERVTPHYRNSLSRYAQLSNYNGEEKLNGKCLPPKTRALHLLNCQIGKTPFKAAKYLRVLDLSGCSFECFPGSVCDLKFLSFLYASSTAITKLPKKFTKLGNLLFLDLSNTSLEVLPSNFCKLQKLLSLNLSNCERLRRLPQSFGNLTNLEHLNLSGSHLEQLPESFSNLPRLNLLDLSNCSPLQGLLGNSHGRFNESEIEKFLTSIRTSG